MPTRQLTPLIWKARAANTEKLVQLLGYKCEHPQCQRPYYSSGLAVHEWCVAGNDLRGVDYEEVWLFILLHPFNLLLLHNSPCHIERRPSKEAARAVVGRRMNLFWREYGLKNVEEAEKDFRSGCAYFVQRGFLKTLLL